MYTPKDFRISDTGACHDLVRQNPFGLLVCSSADGEAPSASHLPFHLDATQGQFGELQVHLARANPQSKVLDGQRVRCIFSGPHAYVSPTWGGDGPAVPTWNYLAVHCIGTAVRIGDIDELSDQMSTLSGSYEADGSWSFEALPEDYRRGMLKGIAGFRIQVEKMIGKAKLSQNKPAEQIAGQAAGLRTKGRIEDAEVAALMEGAAKS